MQAVNHCKFHGAPLQLSPALIDRTVRSYFTTNQPN